MVALLMSGQTKNNILGGHMTNKQLWRNISVVVVAFGLTACGDGMIGAGTLSSGNGGLGGVTEPKVDLAGIERETAAAEIALVEAEAALDSALKSGRIASTGEGVSVQSLTGLPERLKEALDKVYDKVTIPVAKAKEMIAKARMQLAVAMAKLDPKNPAHAEMIAKLTEALAKLDGVESRLTGVYKALASKIDVVLAGVDQLIAKVSGNPLLFLIVMELQEVRQVIVDFQERLANT